VELFGSPPGPKPRMSLLVFITAGVLLSRLMTRTVKLRFIFGLFDWDDSGALDKPQFVLFLASFVRGLAPVFGVSGHLPCTSSLRRTAERCYVRIGAVARRFAAADAGEAGEAGGALPYDTLEQWLCGELSDQDCLALPYKLAIERFCRTQMQMPTSAMADEFWAGQPGGFRLSHSEPVVIPQVMQVCPKHDDDVKMCTYLRRPTVILAREMFCHATRAGRIRLNEDELEQLLQQKGLDASFAVKRSLLEALEQLAGSLRPGDSVQDIQLFDFFQLLCPCAQQRHLLMFESWCNEYTEFEEEHMAFEKLEGCRHLFQLNSRKPTLSQSELQELEGEFERLDADGTGFIDVGELQRGWNWSKELASQAITTFDSSQDRCIDKQEFLQMMCPPGYKLPVKDDTFGCEVIGRLLDAGLHQQQQQLDSGAVLHRKGTNNEMMPTPPSALPEVPPRCLRRWSEFFDSLDSDSDQRVTVKELEASGLVSTEVAEALVRLIDHTSKLRFSKDAFLAAMCRDHGYRMKLSDGLAPPQ